MRRTGICVGRCTTVIRRGGGRVGMLCDCLLFSCPVLVDADAAPDPGAFVVRDCEVEAFLTDGAPVADFDCFGVAAALGWEPHVGRVLGAGGVGHPRVESGEAEVYSVSAC